MRPSQSQDQQDKQDFMEDAIDQKFEIELTTKAIELIEEIAQARVKKIVDSTGLNSTPEQQLSVVLDKLKELGMVEVLVSVLNGDDVSEDDHEVICTDCEEEAERSSNN